MRAIALALPSLLLILTACTSGRSGSRTAAPVAAPVPAPVVAPVPAPVAAPPTAPAASVATPPAVGPSSATPVGAEGDVARNAPTVARIAAPASAIQPGSEGAATSKRATSHAPSTPSTAVQAGGPAPKQAIAGPAAGKSPADAPLDLAALEQRLRETHAIGVFTKLSLKNQVDDLLDQFRANYRQNGPPPSSTLRERYDLLILKVLSLLQDGDPSLAKTIGSSREAIWGILNDPAKLAAI